MSKALSVGNHAVNKAVNEAMLTGLSAQRSLLSFTRSLSRGEGSHVSLGALAFHYAGYRLGVERLKQWCENYGHRVAITPKDINKAQQWLQRYGVWALLYCLWYPNYDP